MTDRSHREVLLVDGPAAGQRVRVHPDVTSYCYPIPADLTVFTFDPVITPTSVLSKYAYYRFGYARNWDGRAISIGWSDGAEPGVEALERWLRPDAFPVKVVMGETNWSLDCDCAIRIDRGGTTIQGVCACGWETEVVSRVRGREVLALVGKHADEAGTALEAYVRSKPAAELTERERAALELFNLAEEANRLVRSRRQHLHPRRRPHRG